MSALLALLALTSANSAELVDGGTPPANEAHATFSQQDREQAYAFLRAAGERQMKLLMFDPDSARFTYTNGFQRGFSRPLVFGSLGKKREGYIACGVVNAKNRYGGYTGPQAFYILVQDDGTIETNYKGERETTCDKGPRVPLQDALRN